VFSCLLERSEDPLGDVITCACRREDLAGVPVLPAARLRHAGEAHEIMSAA
jgi:hypothetical protein